jgi:hypothetical protein
LGLLHIVDDLLIAWGQTRRDPNAGHEVLMEFQNGRGTIAPDSQFSGLFLYLSCYLFFGISLERTQLGSDETLAHPHSKSGWTTIPTFRQSLDWPAGYYKDEIPAGFCIQLILDLSLVHRSDQIKKYEKDRHIRLWFFPAGFTDDLEHVDRAVFGAMKTMFRRLFEQVWRGNPDKRPSRLAAIQLLKQIWQTLSVNSIRKGWSVSHTSFGTAGDTDADPAP